MSIRKLFVLPLMCLLTTAIASTLSASPVQEAEMMKKKETRASRIEPPKSDAEILKCISDKFAASKSIKNGAATVSNGEATLTGEAKSGGAKGGATRSAQACGAQKVTNKITLSEDSKKTTDKKSESMKK